MPTKRLKTSDIARELGVHVNTIRLYEENGFLPEIPCGKNGYRLYSALHLRQFDAGKTENLPTCSTSKPAPRRSSARSGI